MRNTFPLLLLAPLILSQTSCGMAAYQMQRLMQIPTSVLRVEAIPGEDTESQESAAPNTEQHSLPPA